MKKKYPRTLIIDKRTPDDYHFGASLPTTILQADGDWMDYLPVIEFQDKFLEPYACVSFTILTSIEALIKRQYGVEKNYSDRFLAYISGTKDKRGNSPREVCDFLRKIGVVPEELWPYEVRTYEEYYAPIPPKLYELAREFNAEWDFRYERVPENAESISQALRCSPLLISVSAWHKRGDKYYRPKGSVDNHATTLFQERAGEFRRVFDTYSPHIKDVEWGATPQMAMRFWIRKKEDVAKEISLIGQIIELLKKLVGMVGEKPLAPVVAPQPQPQPIVEPIGSKLIEWATAIRDYEGKPGDLNYRNNNPGNIRGVKGPFLKFKTWEEGWNALLDYLTRAATGKHKSYKPDFTLLQFFKVYAPSADKNNPHAYASYVAKRIGVTVDTKIKNLV